MRSGLVEFFGAVAIIGFAYYSMHDFSGKKDAQTNTIPQDTTEQKQMKVSSDSLTMDENFDTSRIWNGHYYIGEWSENKKKPHGKGALYTISGGKVYEGDWIYGRQTGVGTFYNPDGSVKKEGYFYKGEYVPPQDLRDTIVCPVIEPKEL